MKELVEKANKRVILGGSGAVNPKITANVDEIISGKDRFETSLLIAKEYFTDSKRVFVASGLTFADALSASTLAVAENAPIILGTKDGLTKEIEEYTNHKDIVLIGGSAVINK